MRDTLNHHITAMENRTTSDTAQTWVLLDVTYALF